MQDRRIPCRVCGKLFTPCNKSTSEIGAFNYREMCCSPECGEQYLHDVMVARGQIKEDVKDTETESAEDTISDTDFNTDLLYIPTVAAPSFKPDNYIKNKKKKH